MVWKLFSSIRLLFFLVKPKKIFYFVSNEWHVFQKGMPLMSNMMLDFFTESFVLGNT